MHIPIDPDYPEEMNYIEDAKPKAVVTYRTSFQSGLPQMDIELIVDSREHDIDNREALIVRRYRYVIYTSGTTGKP